MTFTKTVFHAATLLAAAVFIGCASSNGGAPPAVIATPVAASELPARAECLVCRKNADLACIDVDVDNKTPTADYNGKRYYFCSEECRSEFMKNPASYLHVK